MPSIGRERPSLGMTHLRSPRQRPRLTLRDTPDLARHAEEHLVVLAALELLGAVASIITLVSWLEMYLAVF